MSRQGRKRRLEAEQNWPTLYQFVAAYCHEDWPIFHGSLAKAIDAAVADYPLAARQTVLREWRDWNEREGSQHDPRAAVNEGFGVNYRFGEPEGARHFMDMIHDKLICSIRADTRDTRKPDWQK